LPDPSQEPKAGSPQAGTVKANLQQSLVALEMQKAYIDSMTRQLELLAGVESEMMAAREAVEAYSGTREGTELMFPVGGGVYIHARAAGTGKVMVSIGSGVSMEEDAGAALERIAGELEKIHREKEELEKNLEMIGQQYENLARKVKAEYYGPADGAQG